jgi:hypothetical protein
MIRLTIDVSVTVDKLIHLATILLVMAASPAMS